MSKKSKILSRCSKVVDGHCEPMVCPVAIEADENKAKYNSILKYSFEEIYVIDASTLQFLEVSRGALANLGYTLDEMLTMSPLDIKPDHSHAECQAIFQSLPNSEEEIAVLNTMHQRKDGSVYDVELRIQYSNSKSPVFIAMVTDVTERNLYEKELKALAFRDPGTNLYNRRYFLEHMEGTINHVNRMHSAIGLILIDMDDFSEVNNKYGHLAGDEIIVDFANKIKKVFSRKTDVVARYGGDEFVVMCIDNTESHLVKKCNDLIKLFNKPYNYEGNKIVQTASIGICVRICKDKSVTSENLIKGADQAMYVVKKLGKNSIRVCENEVE